MEPRTLIWIKAREAFSDHLTEIVGRGVLAGALDGRVPMTKVLTPKALPFIAAALLRATVAANASPYVVTFAQVGTSVVATGSGNIDLAGLTLSTLHPNFFAGINPPQAGINLNQGSSVDEYTGTISGPPSGVTGPGFGPGIGMFIFADNMTGTGNFVALSLHFGFVGVFHGYVSDDPLGTSTNTWSNATFTSLGLTPGNYEWTWGTDPQDHPDQSFTIEIPTPGVVPLPAALPLFATGIGGLGFLGWRRKRKAQAVALTRV
jgi:hypothetical protein